MMGARATVIIRVQSSANEEEPGGGYDIQLLMQAKQEIGGHAVDQICELSN
jgi:hypothetical protein